MNLFWKHTQKQNKKRCFFRFLTTNLKKNKTEAIILRGSRCEFHQKDDSFLKRIHIVACFFQGLVRWKGCLRLLFWKGESRCSKPAVALGEAEEWAGRLVTVARRFLCEVQPLAEPLLISTRTKHRLQISCTFFKLFVLSTVLLLLLSLLF